MITAATIILLGFFLGMRHALDADHVVAVSTIVSRERKLLRAAGVGALWGIGHSLTILVVGGAIVIFRIALPPRASAVMEFCVAIMLVVLGIRNLRSHPHEHHHDETRWPSMFVGIVHGLAGSAAVALLIVPAIRSQLLATIYLAVFGAGTIAGMILMTCTMAMPMLYAQRRFAPLGRHLGVVFGIVSICFGVFLGAQIVL
ncbi:MAG TPA: high-affinity nickel-transport family protein [Thermoanaerobaculia bacterium]|nr:high-affinity nickel-transport family protein [Thermoanaerobaculia bacterium]